MASGWNKSILCKSNALKDVYLPNSTTSSKKSGTPAFSCTSSSQTLRDVVFLIPNKVPPPPKKSQSPHSNFSQIQHQNPKPNPKSKPKSKPKALSIPSPPPSPVSLPTLVDLPPGHSSRRVVELIFESSWSPRGSISPFPGEIEMLFRVHHPPRSVARFEDHRSAVRSRSDDPRCAADGNEMMRFHPSVAASAAAGAIYNAGLFVCTVGTMKGVRTFAGSGRAHATAGDEPGRRAMLVCRVIAGRVRDGPDSSSDADSIRVGKGELLVFDPRAVLPCFLIIYKIPL